MIVNDFLLMLEGFEVFLIGNLNQAARQQIISCIAIADPHDLADLSQINHIFLKKHFP